MKFVSFEASSPMGPQARVGAIDSSGRVVDLAAAYRLLLIGEGLAAEAASRISQALLPGDMVELIEGGARSLAAAREALRVGAALHSTVARPAVAHEPNALTLLPPVPRPPVVARFHGFRNPSAEHLSEARP